MSITGLHGRAVTDPEAPIAYAFCDRCNFLYNINELAFQYDYRGNALKNIKLLVCRRTCYDDFFEFNRPIILPPDPEPILDARPGFFQTQEGPAPAPGFENALAQLIDQP